MFIENWARRFLLLLALACAAGPVIAANVKKITESFRVMYPKVVRNLEVDRIAYSKRLQVWNRYRITCDRKTLRYDVRKTDSLVNPYIGTITYEGILVMTRNCQSLHDAESAPMAHYDRQDVTITFAWRDGQWKFLDQDWNPHRE